MDQDAIEAGSGPSQSSKQTAGCKVVLVLTPMVRTHHEKVGHHTFKCPLTAAWMQSLPLLVPTRKLD